MPLVKFAVLKICRPQNLLFGGMVDLFPTLAVPLEHIVHSYVHKWGREGFVLGQRLFRLGTFKNANLR